MMGTLPEMTSTRAISILVVTREPGLGDLLFSKMLPPGESNPAPFIGDYNHRPTKSTVPAEPHVAGDGKVVELEDEGNGAEALLEISNVSASLTTGVWLKI